MTRRQPSFPGLEARGCNGPKSAFADCTPPSVARGLEAVSRATSSQFPVWIDSARAEA